MPASDPPSDHRPGSASDNLRDQYLVGQRFPKRRTTGPLELCATKYLVGTVDDFVAVQSLLVQQRSTSLNTPRVSH